MKVEKSMYEGWLKQRNIFNRIKWETGVTPIKPTRNKKKMNVQRERLWLYQLNPPGIKKMNVQREIVVIPIKPTRNKKKWMSKVRDCGYTN